MREKAVNAEALRVEQLRRREVGDELKRLARHTGKYIKTSVWNKGVPQRLPTLDLYHGLTKEFNALKAVVADLK